MGAALADGMTALRPLLVSLAGLLGGQAYSQSPPSDESAWVVEHLDRKTTFLRSLTAWGATNVAAGGVGALAADEEQWRQFGLMSAGWGLVNAALGGFGLRSVARNRKEGMTFREGYADLQRTERILLFNAGLDVAYLVGGAYLIERSRRSSNENADRDRGWGRAIVLQGAGLLVADALGFRYLRRGHLAVQPVLNSEGAGLGARLSFR